MLQQLGQAQDVKHLDHDQIKELAAEIRQFLIASVCRTGGHLGPNLGIVELTLALHRVFDSPRDLILWDTGHQAYVHKLLTGRTDFSRLRKQNGVSGYPSRNESVHDVIENSHASTALSYADGLAKAWQLRGMTDRTVVAVVGDGAMTGGMAWEALNNLAAAPDRPVVIVLNDNGRSYAETFGGLAQHLRTLRQVPESFESSSAPSCLFAELGLGYLGPIDGHDTAAVEETLRQAHAAGGPVVVHCVTKKGHGYPPAENDARDRFHGIGVLDPRTGTTPAVQLAAPSWTSVFGEELTNIADQRDDVVAITAAMLAPVGLERFAAKYPRRVFDVGIAEQHAVTSAAGLAAGGLHPVVAVYATFLNRAFDQVLLDVALHRAGVTFVLDRAGVTGDDGASHNGMWDMSILQVVPGLRLAAPRDAEQLRAQLREAVEVSDAPTVIRFPKGSAVPVVPNIDRIDGVDVLFRAGSAEDLLLISFGALAETCVEVGHRLAAQGVGVTVVDPRWIKPVNETLLALAARSRLVVTVEDNVRTGGCGAAFHQALGDHGIRVDCVNSGIPARFLAQGNRSEVLRRAGLVTSELTGTILRRLADDKRTASWPQADRTMRRTYAGQVTS
jgi:1-deoxy-D-xylulose-5-phosphate synthase